MLPIYPLKRNVLLFFTIKENNDNTFYNISIVAIINN